MHEGSNNSISLTYAICAYVLATSSQSAAWVMSDSSSIISPSTYHSGLYNAAQNALQQTTQTQTSEAPSLRELQATVLLGLYDLHQAEFGRAWVTASRAVWITKALRLHTLDSCPRNTPIDPSETEEARMAFWATMGLTGFISLGGHTMDSIGISQV